MMLADALHDARASRSRCSNRPRSASSASARARRRGCAASSTASASRNRSGCRRATPPTSAASPSTSWSTKPGFESYFHPFASMLDNLTLTQFVHNAEARVERRRRVRAPEPLLHLLAPGRAASAPKPGRTTFPFDVWYGYHFDAVLLGQFLQKKAIERGVKYKSCHVSEVQLDENGDIASVATKDGETIAADFFVDCTGFAGLLIQKTLKHAVRELRRQPVQRCGGRDAHADGRAIPSQTVSTALKHGWALEDPAHQPLRQRLRVQLGVLLGRRGRARAARTPRHCSTNAGAPPEDEDRARHQALEPQLPRRGAVAGLHRAARGHRAAVHPAHRRDFVELLEAGDMTRKRAGTLQRSSSTSTSRARATTSSRTTRPTSRTDTEYWRANAANPNLSEPLQQLYRMWMSGKSIAADVGRQTIGKGYPIFSWYCIMAGMGIFPDREGLRPPRPGSTTR